MSKPTCGTCDMCVPDRATGLMRCNAGMWNAGDTGMGLSARTAWTIPACNAYVPGDPIPDRPQSLDYQGDDLLCNLCRMHGVAVDAVRSPSRVPKLVSIRRTIARDLRQRGMTLTGIARLLNRDHSSVCHLIAYTPREYKSA